MLQHAAELGANAVIGMRYDATEVMQGVTEVLAYGTAVVVEKGRMNTERHGEPGRNRTCDPRIKSALLYQLSYGPTLTNLPQRKSAHPQQQKSLRIHPPTFTIVRALQGELDEALFLFDPDTGVSPLRQ